MFNQLKAPFRFGGVAITLTLFLGLLFSTAPALAARGHEFSKTFAGPCTLEPCEGNLKEPAGVAVNEATGEVYVVDKGADRVARFSAGGSYESEFNGSGTLLNGNGETFEGKAAGSGPREVPTGRFEAPEDIAVDNSCASRAPSELTKCKEQDPSYGDVYVVDAGHRVIDKYSSSGEYIGQLSEDGAGRFAEALEGVAVGSQGQAWVYLESGRVDEFSNEAVGKFERSAGHLPATFGLPHGIALDGAGDFYLRHTTGSGPRVSKAAPSPSGEVMQVLIEEVDPEDSSSVAVDQTPGGDVFIDNITTVGVFSSQGAEIERLGEEKGAKHLTSGAGIGVNAGAGKSEGSGSLYVADAATDQIVVFGPTNPEAPKVESESISEITADSAKLGAEINPQSEAGEAATEYRFEYGACSSPSTCSSSPYQASAPIPSGQLEADFSAQAVSASIEGLQASSTYHFRTIASNAHGQGAPGEEKIFTTQGAGGQLILPDNRGWELVTPPDKQGALVEPISEAGVVQAAASGDGITYLTNSPTEAQPQGAADQSQVLSRRSASEWSSRDIAIPHSGATGFAVGPGPEYKFFNPELTLSAVQPFGEFIPQLSEEASESTAYLHDLSDSCGSSCFHPLVTGKGGFANVPEGTVFGEEEECEPRPGGKSIVNCGPRFLGATEDLSHVVLRAKAPLKTGAGNKQLYEWSGGQLSQVSLLPGNEPTPEGAAQLGLKDEAARRAISSDGSRIDWEAEGNLYQREMPRGETIELDAAGCEGCESGGGRFQIASADGSRVFFTSERALSAGSGAEASSPPKLDLYECRIVLGGEGKEHCALSDLTPKNGAESAEVQGGVLGASEDGSIVYFVAKGVQSEAQNARGEKAIAGKPNLYLRREGQTSFIATLSSGDNHDWDEELEGQPTRVSPNGQFLELMSEARLSGYDNRDVATSKAVAEVYLFDAASNKLACASCDPSGARPVGVEYNKLEPGSGGLVGGPRGIWRGASLVAANVPGWTAIGTSGQLKNRYQPRYLNDSGRLFFNSADSLVAQDSNNTEDVYEYEPPGVGNCSEGTPAFSSSASGCISLISSGASNRESAFMDASESGDDVFFLTAAKLSKLDTDAAFDIYDAHVCTGASPCITYSGVQSPPCTTEASCKASPSPQPSIFGAPASATFQGPGNLTPAAAVKAKAKPLTRAQKLAAALKACKKKAKKQRAGCEKQARKRFGPVKKSKKKK